MTYHSRNYFALVLVCFILGMQLFRAFFVLYVNAIATTSVKGIGAIVGIGVVLLLAHLLLPLLLHWISYRKLLIISVMGIVLSRLLFQFYHSPQGLGWMLSGGSVVVAFITWQLLIVEAQTIGTPYEAALVFTSGGILGLAIDTALRSVFLTWDPLWQTRLLPILITLILCAIAIGLLLSYSKWSSDGASVRIVQPLSTFSVFILTNILFLQNVGLISAALQIELPVAVGSVTVINVAILWNLDNIRYPSRISHWINIGAIFLMTLVLPHATGIAAIVILVSGHLIAIDMLFTELIISQSQDAAILHPASAPVSGTILFGLMGAIYTVSILLPTWLASEITLGVGIILLIIALAGWKISLPHARPRYPFVVFICLGLLINPTLIPSSPKETIVSQEPITNNERSVSLRVLSYNIHFGVNTQGILDLEDLARVIEVQNPDIIALQEVSRGVLDGGSVDALTWLSIRLDMPYIFSPSRDWQIGNAILSRLPLREWHYGILANSKRTYLLARYDIGSDTPLTFINTHLSAAITPDKRMSEINTVLAAWDEATPAIITGDMNSTQTEKDIQLYYHAGLIDAQASAGNPNQRTFFSDERPYRVDYVFGTNDLIFSDFRVIQTNASDHLPIVTSVQIR